jgi:hypothetical protein
MPANRDFRQYYNYIAASPPRVARRHHNITTSLAPTTTQTNHLLSSNPSNMKFSATLLFLFGNAVLGLALPAAADNAAAGSLEKRQNCQKSGICVDDERCCSGLCRMNSLAPYGFCALA